jgi:mannose-6-phosphate isomerase
MPPQLYPLRFEPSFRRYLWGGRRLKTILHKPIGDGEDYAESWEIVDHGKDQSIVAGGPLAGTTLHQLTQRYSEELFGSAQSPPSFPLLFKFLDANQQLSVQVHPNDEQAARQQPPDFGKTEAWLVLHADPGSVVYAGLKPGVNRHILQRAIEEGTTERYMHHFEARSGDCVFIPAGIVHALGAGLVIAEIQQSSDTTFRLFDWNRLGPNGKPRDLHVEQALQVTNFEQGPVSPQRPQPTENPSRVRLVKCDYFTWDRWEFDGMRQLGGDGRSHILAIVRGAAIVEGDPLKQPMTIGQTMLLPASLGSVSVSATQPTTILDAFLPS